MLTQLPKKFLKKKDIIIFEDVIMIHKNVFKVSSCHDVDSTLKMFSRLLEKMSS